MKKVELYNKGENLEIFFEHIADENDLAIEISDVEHIQRGLEKIKGVKCFEVGFKPISIEGYSEWYNTSKIYYDSDKDIKEDKVYTNAITDKWSIYYKLVIETPKNIRYVNIFLKELGIELEEKEKQPVRDVIKGEEYVLIELN